MKHFSIDRFEGNSAILIDDDGCDVSILRQQVPSEAKEGDMLSFDGEKYVLDPDATADRRAAVKSLIDDLFR